MTVCTAAAALQAFGCVADDERRDGILDTLTARAPDPSSPDQDPSADQPDTPRSATSTPQRSTSGKTTRRAPVSPRSQMQQVDDGIARLTAMLRDKERGFSSTGASFGAQGTLGSPRAKAAASNNTRRPMSARVVKQESSSEGVLSEPTLTKGLG